MPFAELGEVTVFFTDDGQAGGAAPLLLVHGWGADSHEWAWHIPALAATRRVIAPDLRGHGYSSTPPGGYSPQHFAADLTLLLDHLGTGPVVAVGHSMGAQIASILAVEHPERIVALVAVDPGYGIAPELAAAFPAMIESLRGRDTHAAAVRMDSWSYTATTPPLIRTWHTRRLLGAHPHVLADSFAAMFTGPGQIGVRPASDAYLARRKCPVLTLRADPAAAQWEQGLLGHPCSQVITWPGCGHRLHEERPDEFVLTMQRWLRSIDRGDRETT
jgi:pimeloyl-ACP methyl ester carboxylesterase